jgi:hypothetical protein
MKAFTIGHTRSYNQAMKEPSGCWKLGRKEKCEEYPEGYEGGCTWLSWEEADRFRREHLHRFEWNPNDFSVYSLDLSDEDISEEISDNGYYYLLKDSKIKDCFSIPKKCEICDEYYLLNQNLFQDCPSCDKKLEFDIDERFMVWLHVFG